MDTIFGRDGSSVQVTSRGSPSLSERNKDRVIARIIVMLLNTTDGPSSVSSVYGGAVSYTSDVGQD